MEPDCWYINFELGFPMECADMVAEDIAKLREPGCYKVHNSPALPYKVDVWGGGKTAAHIKRRAAAKNPRAEWVQFSRFIVKKAEEVR